MVIDLGKAGAICAELHVEVFHFEGVGFDELAAAFDVFAHEGGEHGFGVAGAFEGDAEEGAAGGVHGGDPEFFGVHFAEAFEAADFDALAADVVDFVDEVADAGDVLFVFLAGFEEVAGHFAFAGIGFFDAQVPVFDGQVEFGEFGEEFFELLAFVELFIFFEAALGGALGLDHFGLGLFFIRGGAAFLRRIAVAPCCRRPRPSRFGVAVAVGFGVGDGMGLGLEFLDLVFFDEVLVIRGVVEEVFLAVEDDAVSGHAVVLAAEFEHAGEGDSAAFDDLDVFLGLFEEGHDFAEVLALVALFFLAGFIADDEAGAVEAEVGEGFAHRAFVLDVLDLLFAGDFVEGRLGDVDAALPDEFGHLAEEEGEEQRADVGAVDVGVGHDDEFAVAQFFDIEIGGADAAGQGLDDGADFLVAEHFVDAGLFDVEDFAFDGEDGLEDAVAAALGGAACGLAFDDVEFGGFHVAGGAIPEFAGEAAGVEGAFAGEFAGFAGGFAGLAGEHAFLDDALGVGGMLFEPSAEGVVDGLGDEAFDFAVAEFVLGLAFKLRVGDFDGDDGGEALAEIVAVGQIFFVFDDVVVLGVLVERAGEGGFEAGEVRAAAGGVDVVGEGVEAFGVAVVVLQGDGDLERGVLAGLFLFEIDRRVWRGSLPSLSCLTNWMMPLEYLNSSFLPVRSSSMKKARPSLR